MLMNLSDDERHPPISAALILEAASLELFRKQQGMVRCASRGIGARRKLLGPHGAKVPVFFAAPKGELEALPIDEAVEIARDQARVLLAAMCRCCPFEACPMKVWGIIEPPASLPAAQGNTRT